jgi:hypothetical protein
MPSAICCGEPDGAGGAGGAEGDGDADGTGDGVGAGGCCWAAVAAARRSARRAAARRTASRAVSSRLCSRPRADWVLESRTCEGSATLSRSPALAPACWALAVVSESAVGASGPLAGQSATTPEVTAAVTTVEPVAIRVIFECLLCVGE